MYLLSKNITILVLSTLFVVVNLHANTPNDLEREANNLLLFAKSYSAIRYFYPSKKLHKIDWEKLLIDEIDTIIKISNNEDLTKYLNEFWESEHLVFKNGTNHLDCNYTNELATKNKKFKHWQHNGYGLTDYSDRRSFMTFIYKLFLTPYNSKIVKVKASGEAVVHPDKWYCYSLIDSITLSIKHGIFLNEKEPNKYKELSKKYKAIQNKESLKHNLLHEQLGALIYSWSILHNFYAYNEAVEDWDSLLIELIHETFKTKSEEEFLYILETLFARINDGHASVYNTSLNNFYTPKITLSFIEGSIVVTDSKESDISVGDIVLEVDDENAIVLLNKKINNESASTIQFKIYKAISNLLNGKKDSPIRIKLEKINGDTVTIEKSRTIFYYNPEKQIPKKSLVDSTILYLDLSRCSGRTIKKSLSKLSGETGVIFDNRPYPLVSTKFLKHISQVDKIESQKWIIPTIELPFYNTVHYDTSSWHKHSKKYKLPEDCKVVFLISSENVSYSETLASMVKSNNIGTIIGQPTAGTNGDMVLFKFLNKYSFSMTGMRVVNHDDSAFNGVGIMPDIEVIQSIEDVRNNQDETLQKAIKFLKK